MWLCDKSASESDGFEIQNPNPTDSDFSWLHHVPNNSSGQKLIKIYLALKELHNVLSIARIYFTF